MKKDRLCETAVQNYYKAIFQFCLQLLNYDGYAAEECTQEVFVLLAQKKNKLNFEQNIRGWLYASAERICKDYRKRESKRLSHITNSLDDIQEQSYDPFTLETDSIFECLTDEERQLLEEYYTEEYGNRVRIAKKYGLTTTQLYKKICYIRKKITRHMDDNQTNGRAP